MVLLSFAGGDRVAVSRSIGLSSGHEEAVAFLVVLGGPLALAPRRVAAFGAGAPLPFPLRPAWCHLCRIATGPVFHARGPTYV